MDFHGSAEDNLKTVIKHAINVVKCRSAIARTVHSVPFTTFIACFMTVLKLSSADPWKSISINADVFEELFSNANACREGHTGWSKSLCAVDKGESELHV